MWEGDLTLGVWFVKATFWRVEENSRFVVAQSMRSKTLSQELGIKYPELTRVMLSVVLCLRRYSSY